MAIRRWIAPRDGKINITGDVAHRQKEGDGIRVRVLSGRLGQLGIWILHNKQADGSIKDVTVKAGETIDFVVDCRPKGNITWDEFFWAPVITMANPNSKSTLNAAAGDAQKWSAQQQFTGPPATPTMLWEQYAQTLLLTNEFVVLD